MWRLLVVVFMIGAITIAASLGGGCDEKPHPNEQAVERAEKRSEQAVEQVQLAREEVKHAYRLRDIDKMKFDSQVADMESNWSVWQLWLFALTILLVIALVWIAREIRLRRVFGHIILCIRRKQLEGGDPD